ncbi:hypothetical protein ACFWBX_27955 [Streptomyces sp. NPDC059991]|uniref:hypothetical protein n=1 Tax=Streptomyces sp. NPDC059991 TaxID=3347028 RepID=UPI00368DDB1E
MNGATTTAHLEPDTEIRVNVFDTFVSVRIGGLVAVSLIADTGTSEVLRSLAHAAQEAAQTLEAMTTPTPEGAA